MAILSILALLLIYQVTSDSFKSIYNRIAFQLAATAIC